MKLQGFTCLDEKMIASMDADLKTVEELAKINIPVNACSGVLYPIWV